MRAGQLVIQFLEKIPNKSKLPLRVLECPWDTLVWNRGGFRLTITLVSSLTSAIHHTPVMVGEVLAALQVKRCGTYVDCTVGEGGHTEAILQTSPTARLIGMDVDGEALSVAGKRLRPHQSRMSLVQGNFADLGELVREQGAKVADGVLFDLGLSSLQVDSGQRGFSFRQEARLDMRFDSGQKTTAHEVVNGYAERRLVNIISVLGEEPKARGIARAIVRDRPIDTTTRLADVVERATRRWTRRSRIHPATRTFQAIRMEVNGELANLRQGLEAAIETLASGGRLVVISYHSLEDRLVKNTLRREASGCICHPKAPECICGHKASITLVNRKVIRPTPIEVRNNPRSRSARMRAAERPLVRRER